MRKISSETSMNEIKSSKNNYVHKQWEYKCNGTSQKEENIKITIDGAVIDQIMHFFGSSTTLH